MTTQELKHLRSNITPGQYESVRDTYGNWNVVTRSGPGTGFIALFNSGLPVDEYDSRALALTPELIDEVIELREVLSRCAPWLRKLIADNGHANCAAPNDAIRSLEMADALLAKANNPNAGTTQAFPKGRW